MTEKITTCLEKILELRQKKCKRILKSVTNTSHACYSTMQNKSAKMTTI